MMEIENWTPYTPLGNNVIVRPLTHEEVRSTGGVIIPDTAGVQKAEGIVLAVGPGVAFTMPKRVLDVFFEKMLKRGIDDVTAAAVEGNLIAACAPTPPDYAVGDMVFFPPWLANWQTHYDVKLEFCCIDAGQILGRQKAGK